MGLSKLICEFLIHKYKSKFKNTNFSIVRFGNVINSSGSVIPIFKNQIEKGGPITITHPKMERYLMSVNEAVKLVLLSHLAIADDKYCFVLDMGNPVKILNIAKLMIKNITGLDFNKSNIKIKYVGIREGEKIFEESLIDKNSIKTKFDKIYYSKQDKISFDDLDHFIKFIESINSNIKLNKFKNEIKKIFKTYISKDFH